MIKKLYNGIYLIVLAAAIIMLFAACSKRNDQAAGVILDPLLPDNIFEGYILSTLNGDSSLSVSKNGKIETSLVLVNLSEYEIDCEPDIYHVRLQKKTGDGWQFIDNDPYRNKDVVGTMVAVFPNSLYGQIAVSLSVDTKEIDCSGEYRLYLPIEYRPLVTDRLSADDIKKACVVMNVTMLH